MTNQTGSSPLVAFEGATLGYGRARVLEDVRWSVERGAFVGLVGPNGSGKTTLLRAVLGALAPRDGRVTMASPPPIVGYVPQRFTIDPIFPLRVDELVAMGRYPHRRGRRPTAEDRRVVADVAARVGIDGLLDRPIRELSGGQQQRALLARALAVEPDLLVLDEPTNGMDLVAEQAILDLVRGLHRERGVTVLFVTHLLHLVADSATDLALVVDGAVHAGPRDAMLDAGRLSAVFGGAVEVVSVGGRTVVRSTAETTP